MQPKGSKGYDVNKASRFATDRSNENLWLTRIDNVATYVHYLGNKWIAS